MTKERSPSGRATRASTEPQERLGHSASVPNAIERMFRPFDTAPRDGTPFVVGFTMRFSPETGALQAATQMADDAEDRAWVTIQGNQPRHWCAALPGFVAPNVSDEEPRRIALKRLSGKPEWRVIHESAVLKGDAQ